MYPGFALVRIRAPRRLCSRLTRRILCLVTQKFLSCKRFTRKSLFQIALNVQNLQSSRLFPASCTEELARTCTYAYVRVCACVCTCTSGNAFICACVHLYVRSCACACMCVRACRMVRMLACATVSLYKHACACKYAQLLYIFTFRHLNVRQSLL